MNVEDAIRELTELLDFRPCQHGAASVSEDHAYALTWEPDRGSAVAPIVAQHEAAHAVVANRCDRRILSALVSARGGLVQYEHSPQQPADLPLVIVGLAGMAWELLEGVRGGTYAFVERAISADLIATRARIAELVRQPAFEGMTNQHFATLAILVARENSDAIESVADALQAHGKLTGDEIAALCGAPQ